MLREIALTRVGPTLGHQLYGPIGSYELPPFGVDRLAAYDIGRSCEVTVSGCGGSGEGKELQPHAL